MNTQETRTVYECAKILSRRLDSETNISSACLLQVAEDTFPEALWMWLVVSFCCQICTPRCCLLLNTATLAAS